MLTLFDSLRFVTFSYLLNIKMKALLIASTIFLLASASNLKGADPAPAYGNYADLQQFLQGFMFTYAGSSYDMSGCLTPATQSSLDQQLASTYGYILTGKFSELLPVYESFLQSLYQACNECGLSTVSSSLNAGISQKGKVWYEINLLYNSGNLEVLLDQSVPQIKAGNWGLVGQSFGQITGIVVPYVPQAKLSSLEMSTTDYQNWWKGLVSTLSINPKKQGSCAIFLLGVGNQTIAVETDFSKIMAKDWTGFNTVFGDLASFLTWYQKTYVTDICNFELLETNVAELATKDGMSQLLLNYATRASLINSAVNTIENCGLSTYSCGQAYGTIIKYLLGWSIN